MAGGAIAKGVTAAKTALIANSGTIARICEYTPTAYQDEVPLIKCRYVSFGSFAESYRKAFCGIWRTDRTATRRYIRPWYIGV